MLRRQGVESLGLGWLSEPALAVLVDRGLSAFGVEVTPGMAHTVAGSITAFAIITFLHIVLGELAPKSVALIMPEQVSRWVARPLMLFSTLMYPFVWFMQGAANIFLRLFGIAPATEASRVHSPEELRLLVIQSRIHGTLDESDSAMIAGVFDVHEKRARDVMRARTDIVALSAGATEAEVWAVLRAERYWRYPVYEETLDNMVGVFLAKDLRP